MADSDKVILLKIELDKAQASANIEKLKNSLKKLDGRRKEARVIVRKLRLEEAKLSDLRAKSSKSISNHANELKNANKQTGAATSATLEFGRVLSDAPYGIRGVANNLQQLASNLFFMSRGTDAVTGKTIGFLGALGTLGKSLLGPAGILVAFQGLTALLDWYSNRSNAASVETRSLKEEIDELNSMMLKQSSTMELVTDDFEEYIKMMELRGKLDVTMAGLEDEKKALDERLEISRKTRDDAKRLMESEDLTAKSRDLQARKYKEYINIVNSQETELANVMSKGQKALTNYNNAKQGLFKTDEKSVKGLEKLKQELQKVQKEVSSSSEIWKTYEASIKSVQDKIDAITGKKGKGSKISPFKNLKDFDKEAEDYLEQIRNLAKKTELLNAKTQVEKIEIDRKHHIQTLKIKHEEDKEEFTQESEAYRAKLKLFLDYQVKTGKMSQAQANQELSDFDINVKSQLDTMDENFPTLLIRWQNYYTKKAEAAKIGEIGTMKPLKDEIKKEETEIEKFERFLARFKEIQGIITNFMNSEFDRQITIEQNKTNALNNELNQRLLNENLSKDERERIQLQIGRNDEKLRKTQERIERKRFNLNKAANMATALLETYASAQKAYFNSLSNPANKLLPDGGMLKAKISAGVATAFGLLNVAAIGRQKFQSSAGSGGTIGASGGGGGGGEGREFNFNLAGSTQSNQLTQSIASQLNQPIQAYVVSSEITSQQQLDLNISNTATIG